jgi:hypothetical protein
VKPLRPWAAPLAALALAAGNVNAPAGPASIVHLRLPPESDERQPIAVPTEPENTVELDFPWPVDDWAGRGFTPDADKFAGDFVIEATRGKSRIFVTPVAPDAHRVLHVVLAPPGLPSRSVPLELLPAPAGLAWRKLVLEDGSAESRQGPAVTLTARPPRSALRESSPESEIGLIRTMRLFLDTGKGGARSVAEANPSLQYAEGAGEPRSFGDFSISLRFALRDGRTGALGLCAEVSNHTRRRLEFDPQSWVVRAGNDVFEIGTADFSGELEPGAVGYAFLVLARGPDGLATRLLPGDDLRLSVLPVASLNPRPVSRIAIPELGPP